MSKKSKKSVKAKQDLHIKSKDELLELLEKTEKEWFKLSIDLKMGKLEDVHVARKKRKEIARIKTIIKAKELKVMSKE